MYLVCESIYFYQSTIFLTNGIVTKIVLTYCEKKNSSDREKLLKFEAEGRECIQTLKGQNNFW